VVGNSGSGKDSIISGAVENYPSNLKKPFIPKRYITRPPSEFEYNIYISPVEFKEMANQGKFALKWHIYGLDYGVLIEIDDWLKKGHSVIVNVSRIVINEARKQYKNIKVIFIEVPFEITVERIKNRGRESEERLKERIQRAKAHQKLTEADFVVRNNGKLEEAVNKFLEYILKVCKK
jgi:ribose 1,5-bisphosphokinase